MTRRILLAHVILLLLAGVACGQVRVIEFTADWCKPCQEMKPIVERLRGEGHQIETVNVEQAPALAKRYGVTSVPTFMAVTPSGVREKVEGKLTYDKLRAMFWWPAAQKRTVNRTASKTPGHCIVLDFAGDGRCGVGSGVLVPGGLILSCAHSIRHPVKHVVKFPEHNEQFAATRVHANTTTDVQVLKLHGTPSAGAVVVGDMLPRRGDVIRWGGYGRDGVWRQSDGRYLLQCVDASKAIMWEGTAREGESGGPVWNEAGELIGLVTGFAANNSGTSVGPGVDTIKIALCAASACDPAQDFVVPEPPDWTPSILPEPDGPEPPPAPSPPAPDPVPVVDLKLVAIVEQHTEQITTIERTIKQLAEEWRNNKPQDGVDGQDGKDAVVNVPEIVQAVIAELDPITVNFLDGEGNAAHSVQVQVDGGVLNLPPQWLRTYRPDGTAYEDTTAALGWPIGIDAEVFTNEGK